VTEDFYAWVVEDPETGLRGVGFVETANSMGIPLAMPTRARTEAMRPQAEYLAKASGRKVTLARFVHGEDLLSIEPQDQE
jgi:hypothetical protein